LAAGIGVDDEFREFVAARSTALLRTAFLLAGDWATAEDLLQTALTKTYLAWRRLGHIEAIEPYARRVLVNTATSWWRRRWHGERPTEVLPEHATADGLDERLERDALWQHVRALPTRQRAVLVLRFYEDQSEADTARLLGVTVGTVKSQCSRALQALRLRLAEQGIEPAVRRAGPRRSSPAGGARAKPPPRDESAPAALGTARLPETADVVDTLDLTDAMRAEPPDEASAEAEPPPANGVEVSVGGTHE
jgi:RNA polymerase sigma-70 factor (sigma-E family)